MTYLNHIPKGSVWNTPDDWGFFLPLCSSWNVEGVADRESFGGEWHYVIPDKRGRLHVRWQHGRESEPEQGEVIVLTLTARGAIASGDTSLKRILDGLDLGRKTIVHSFRNLMSDEANKHWGLNDARE